jgi:hypothetical protein
MRSRPRRHTSRIGDRFWTSRQSRSRSMPAGVRRGAMGLWFDSPLRHRGKCRSRADQVAQGPPNHSGRAPASSKCLRRAVGRWAYASFMAETGRRGRSRPGVIACVVDRLRIDRLDPGCRLPHGGCKRSSPPRRYCSAPTGRRTGHVASGAPRGATSRRAASRSVACAGRCCARCSESGIHPPSRAIKGLDVRGRASRS